MNPTKLNITPIWEQNQDLNFGQIVQVVAAAEAAAEDKARMLYIEHGTATLRDSRFKAALEHHHNRIHVRAGKAKR